MLKKRNMSLLALLILAAIMLVACGGAAGGTATEEVEGGDQGGAEGGEPAECAGDDFGCAVIEPGQTIKIGMGAPMTGDYAAFGVDISQGGEIAVQDAGEFNGFTFELVAEDDEGSGEGGAAVANRLVADPTVVAIAGHIFSGATEAAIPTYEERGIPMLSPSATNPPLTQMGSKVFNRVAFTDAVQGKFAAEYLYNTLGIRRLAVMHDGEAYGQGLAEVVAEEFGTLGGEVVATEAITPGESDYSAALAAVADADPEGLYYGGYVAEAVVLVNQMDSAGLEDVAFFGCDGTFGADFLEGTDQNGEGAYGTSLIPPSSPEKDAFDQAYEEQFGDPPGTLSPFTWNGYDSVAALIYAIEQVAILGDDGNLYIPRGALVAAVRGLTDYQGLGGTITCDETGECNATGPTFYVVQDGEWVSVNEAG